MPLRGGEEEAFVGVFSWCLLSCELFLRPVMKKSRRLEPTSAPTWAAKSTAIDSELVTSQNCVTSSETFLQMR